MDDVEQGISENILVLQKLSFDHFEYEKEKKIIIHE